MGKNENCIKNKLKRLTNEKMQEKILHVLGLDLVEKSCGCSFQEIDQSLVIEIITETIKIVHQTAGERGGGDAARLHLVV